MPDNEVWPPKPALPDPLTEYDQVIAAKLAALSASELGPSRLLLIKALRDEERIDLRQAYALVNDYCARNGVLVQTRASRMKTWFGCLPLLLWICFAGFIVYWMKRRDEILSQPHHHAAFLALTKEALVVCFVAVMLAFVNVGVQQLRRLQRRKK